MSPLVVLAVLGLAWPVPASLAHPAPFSYLDLRLTAAGVTGSLVVHDLDAAFELKLPDANALLDPDGGAAARAGAGGDPRPGGCTCGSTAASSRSPCATSSRCPIGRACGSPSRSSPRPHARPHRPRDRRSSPTTPTHQTFVNVYEGEALRHQAILDARHTTFTYYAGSWQGVGAVLGTFLPAGAYHIAIGPDHLLFLLGLLLLGGSLARLGVIVTAFTVGHTVTLSLAALGLYAPPAAMVEPLIALSIVLVGVDNLLVGDGAAASRDLRPWMAGLFGLVHGFGFASVLREFGLPREALGWSLFGFNLGVEVGQLAFVLPVAAAAGSDPRPLAARRRAAGDGRLNSRRAGRRVLVRPTRVLPRE